MASPIDGSRMTTQPKQTRATAKIFVLLAVCLLGCRIIGYCASVAAFQYTASSSDLDHSPARDSASILTVAPYTDVVFAIRTTSPSPSVVALITADKQSRLGSGQSPVALPRTAATVAGINDELIHSAQPFSWSSLTARHIRLQI